MTIGNTGGTNVNKASAASQILGSNNIGQKSGIDKLNALTEKANGAINGNPELSLEGALTEAIGIKG